MTEPLLRKLADAIAAKLDGFSVHVEREEDGWWRSTQWTSHGWLVHTDGRRLWLQVDRTGRRLVVTGQLPPGGGSHVERSEISVRMDRDPDQIAADIARRLLPQYGRALAMVRAELDQRAREAARRVEAAQRVAAIIPGARVDTRIEGRTTVSWSSTRAGAQGIGYGELEFFSSAGAVMKARDLPLAIVEQFAAVLAAATKR